VDLSDGISTLGFLFLGNTKLACLEAADANDSGGLDLTDAVFTFLYLFSSGSPIPQPGPTACGLDPTPDDLGCAASASCPVDCPAGFYCKTDVGDCPGEGTCKERDVNCPENASPVCGCDGQTYSNACFASAAGVNVAYDGQCVPESCSGNLDCPEGFYCARAVDDCAGKGTCQKRPTICPRIFRPVCGCDGKTYSNACEAAGAGVSVAYEGECGMRRCGDLSCPDGFYCAKVPGDCAGSGACKEFPVTCPDIFRPVCGCDGNTYGNDCEAALAGVNVQFDGECGPR